MLEYLGCSRHSFVFRATTFVVLVCAVFTSVARAQELDSELTLRDWFSGELELGLNAGRSSRDSDIELEQLLRLNVDPPKQPSVHVRSTLWTIEDLDGDESPTSPFRGLSDTSDAAINARLLRLYVELESEKDDARIRLGRQRITDGVAYNRIDGVYLSLSRSNWDYYAFLGARASIYENSHDDISTGAGVAWRLRPGTRLALDIFYGEDERRRVGSDDVESTLTSLSLRHALNAYHHLFGRATWHEDNLDEFQFSAQGVLPDDVLLYVLSYRKRVSTLDERPTDFPQFYHVVGELNGYDDVQAIVSVPIGNRFEVGLEAQSHDAETSSLTSGNRDYQRYGLSFSIDEIAGHYDARLIFEYWDARHGESEKTISGEVSRQWARTEATVGVDYDRFQDRIIQYDPVDFDTFFIESKEDIYSLFFKLRYDLNEQSSLMIRTSVEEDDTTDAPYWRLYTQYTYRF